MCPEDYFEDENYKVYLNGKASGYPSGRDQGYYNEMLKNHGQYGDRTRDIRVISTTL